MILVKIRDSYVKVYSLSVLPPNDKKQSALVNLDKLAACLPDYLIAYVSCPSNFIVCVFRSQHLTLVITMFSYLIEMMDKNYKSKTQVVIISVANIKL